jgi:hypothetical protein
MCVSAKTSATKTQTRKEPLQVLHAKMEHLEKAMPDLRDELARKNETTLQLKAHTII